MSLDPPPSEATLRALYEARTRRDRDARTAGLPIAPPTPTVVTIAPATTIDRTTLVLPWSMLHTENGFFRLAGKAYREGMRRARAEVERQCAPPYPYFALGTDVALTVRFVMPDRRRRDMLNYTKFVCDALTGLLYADDSQIERALVTRGIDVDAPRALVDVRPAPLAEVPSGA